MQKITATSEIRHREGYIAPERLYTHHGINQATGLSTKALDEGRQAGLIQPIEKFGRLWYLGADLIKWIEITGKRKAKAEKPVA